MTWCGIAMQHADNDYSTYSRRGNFGDSIACSLMIATFWC